MHLAKIGLLAALMFSVVPAHAGLYKCMKDGKMVFSDIACPAPIQPAAQQAQTPAAAPAPVQMPAPQPEAAPVARAKAAEPEAAQPVAAVEAAPAPATPSAATEVASAEEAAASDLPAIPLPNGKTELRLGPRYGYLDPKEAKRVLEEVWGNPPGSGDHVDGMIVPKGVDMGSEESWGVVITYDEDGHVSDSDAAEINYDKILKDMKEAVTEENESRQQSGYAGIELVGWAESPHYDAATHKIYWAKDLKFGGGETHTLNYCIRVLGREGVLELNAVSSTDNLFETKRAMEKVVAFADFTQGNRYEEYNASTDKLAAYGLAALVAGGLAAKKGMLAGLLLLALKLKKLALIAVLGLVGLVKKLLGGGKKS